MFPNFFYNVDCNFRLDLDNQKILEENNNRLQENFEISTEIEFSINKE